MKKGQERDRERGCEEVAESEKERQPNGMNKWMEREREET